MLGLTYQIIGTALEVHKELGCGFREPVYQEALELEFGDRGIPFRPQAAMPVFYKGRRLKAPYRPDFVCYVGALFGPTTVRKESETKSAQSV